MEEGLRGMQAPEFQVPDGMRAASKTDWRKLGDIIGEAFAEDPVNLWIFGEQAAMKPVFSTLARAIYLPRGYCQISGDEGATMWTHSSASLDLPLLPTLELVWVLSRKGAKGAVKRALGAGAAMQREHPGEPHVYLFAIGTRKAARGKGLGKALIAPGLAAADRAGLPCYLENSNPANTGFYRHHGFERMKLFEPGPGGPPLEAMWREPRSALA
ncbi:MAG: GNAT family N-acetyltransferase [Hyphomonadaceae bacterium]